MLNIYGKKNMMVEYIVGEDTIGLHDIDVQDVVIKNGHQIISDEEGRGVSVPENATWTECGDDLEAVWETDLGNGTMIRLSWDR